MKHFIFSFKLRLLHCSLFIKHSFFPQQVTCKVLTSPHASWPLERRTANYTQYKDSIPPHRCLVSAGITPTTLTMGILKPSSPLTVNDCVTMFSLTLAVVGWLVGLCKNFKLKRQSFTGRILD